SIARQVCEGLEEAHRVGVVHRDLKPQNIMIDRDGNARIMDFGIARSVKGKGITGAGMLIGTPEYMSPEQVDGKEAGPRSDLYSLGVVLFEMLTGRLPFEGETPLSVAVKQKSEAPPDPRTFSPQVPEDLARAVLQCLEKAPEKRPDGAAALSARLTEIASVLPTTATPMPLRKAATSKSITVRLPSKRIWIPAVVLAALLGAFLIWRVLPEKDSARRSIAVMGFRNQTGDASFDYLRETIPNLLITSLEQSGRFRVITWQQIEDLLRQSGQGEAAALDEEACFEVCRKHGIEALAVGFFAKAGETFVTDVKVLEAATKRSLKTAQASGEGAASILKAQIDEISRAISRGSGLAALKAEKPQPRIVDVTTSSLEAYNAYLRGRDELDRFFGADARRSLEKAVSLDPEFAVAYLFLSRANNELGDGKARDEALGKARQYAGKATEKERLYIEAACAGTLDRDGAKQLGLLRELVGKFPSEKQAYYDLGRYYNGTRNYAEALAAFLKAIDLDPQFGNALNEAAYAYVKMGEPAKGVPYLERYAAANPGDPNPLDSLAELLMRTGKLDESVAKYKEVLAAHPDFYLSWASLAYVHALQENYPAAMRCLDERIARSPAGTARMQGIWMRAYYRYLLGQWDRARKDFREIGVLAEQAGAEFMTVVTDWILASLLADRREFEGARQRAASYAAVNTRRNPKLGALYGAQKAMLEARTDLVEGRAEAAGAALRKAEGLLAEVDESARGASTPFALGFLKAEEALASGRIDEAIAKAEKVVFQNLTTLRDNDVAAYNNQPFLKDVLARAYWKKGDLDRAAAEYRRLLTVDPANQVRYLMSPLYHYRLGRVLEEKGDRSGARAEYAKFLAGWKDADPGHPELADARKRLAALR
ncbi:MAG TPA: protein kinase, partial [Acidobacteriota bacterium]|nr:protein kinase [Acidobacteriota bacterium]